MSIRPLGLILDDSCIFHLSFSLTFWKFSKYLFSSLLFFFCNESFQYFEIVSPKFFLLVALCNFLGHNNIFTNHSKCINSPRFWLRLHSNLMLGVLSPSSFKLLAELYSLWTATRGCHQFLETIHCCLPHVLSTTWHLLLQGQQ